MFQRGHAGDGLFEMLAEMIEVIVKEAEFPIGGNVARHPALGVRLIPAHHKAADLFLEIGAPIRVTQGGGVGGKAVDLFGDDVLVFHRVQRHRDPGHRAQLARPHAAAVHHLVASDVPLGGFHMGDAATVHPEPGDSHPFDDLRAVHPRAFGERLGDVRGARLPVGRQPAGPDKVRGVHQGPHPFDLISADQLHIHPETAGGGGKAFVFGPAVLGGGKAQTARHLPAGIKAGLGGKPFVKIDRVFQHLGDRRRGAQLPNQPRRVPCASAGDLTLLQQEHIGLVISGQVIGSRTADDAATDHDNLGLSGKCHVKGFRVLG